MKRTTPPSWCIAIATGVFLLMCGCAVMTVDVDVYKGPLANERDVQLHQVAVMAVGAKPLLKQFRDERELSAYASNAGDQTIYRELAKDAPNEIIGYEFEDSAASRANEVLSLYSSRQRHPDPLLADLIDQHHEARERYSRAYSALRGQPLSEMRTRLRAVIMGMGDEPIGEAHESRKLARSAYAEAVAPTPVGDRWHFYEADLWNAYEALPHRKDNPELLILEGKTNRQFEFLAEWENVREDVRVIFGGLPDETQYQIIEATTAAARGFLNARQALADLLRISIDILERVNDPLFATPARAAVSKQATEQLAAYISDYLISSNSFTNALKADPREQDALAWLGLKEEGAKLLIADTGESFPRSRVRERLAEAIIRNPQAGVEHLRRLHNSQEDTHHPFGIASGPMKSGEELSSGEELTPALLDQESQPFVNTLQGGFSRGRHDNGLDDIIDDFILAATNASEGLDPDGTLDRKRKVLLEALVQYAEKVLFVTDHASLVDGGGGGTRVVHGPNSIRITNGERDIRGASGEISVQARNDAYLLQAIGNSILVQVNELVAHDAYSRGEKLAYSRLHDNTTTVGEETEESPRAIMDRIIFRIESCLREEVVSNGSGSEKAKSLAAALALANEQRARMVYIRPPSFYLKNSYPVTSLVDNQHQGLWKNMLAQQAGRSVPLFGEEIESGSQADRDAAKLQHEIDGRFWQNINRIRVAGAGRTNYALVKDAVGNWNVKSFTSNPDPIIEAAKASFLAASGGLPMASGLGTTLTPPALPNPRDTRVDRLKDVFAQRTRDDADATSEFINSLPSQVKAALAADPLATRVLGLAAAVDRSHADIFGSPPSDTGLESDTAGPATEEAILQSLRALRRYRDVLAASISTAEIPAEVPDPGAARQAAHRVVDARITRPLRDLVDRRVVSVEGHRAALHVMHEMLAEAAPPSAPPPVP